MNDKVAILEDQGFGFFRVTHCGSVIADFLYCTGSGEQGYMTRESDTGITFVEKEQPIFND